MENAQLANAILDRAVLHGTSFRTAKLNNVSFLEAQMAGTVFVGADLSKADLRDVTMNLLSLAGTNLSYATLTGKDLTQANLIGADLSCSNPWKAKLFPNNISLGGTLSEVEGQSYVHSVQDLIDRIRTVRSHHPNSVLYFRGESSDVWELRPSVMRRSANTGCRLRANESDMLTDLLTRRPQDFSNIASALSQWVLSQHHGLPTRLLDVTKNPLEAISKIPVTLR